MNTHIKSVPGTGTVLREAGGGTALRVPFRVEIYQELVGREKSPGLYDLRGWVQIDDEFERMGLVGVPAILEIEGGGGKLHFTIVGVKTGTSGSSRCEVVFKGDVSEFLIANGCPI